MRGDTQSPEPPSANLIAVVPEELSKDELRSVIERILPGLERAADVLWNEEIRSEALIRLLTKDEMKEVGLSLGARVAIYNYYHGLSAGSPSDEGCMSCSPSHNLLFMCNTKALWEIMIFIVPTILAVAGLVIAWLSFKQDASSSPGTPTPPSPPTEGLAPPTQAPPMPAKKGSKGGPKLTFVVLGVALIVLALLGCLCCCLRFHLRFRRKQAKDKKRIWKDLLVARFNA